MGDGTAKTKNKGDRHGRPPFNLCFKSETLVGRSYILPGRPPGYVDFVARKFHVPDDFVCSSDCTERAGKSHDEFPKQKYPNGGVQESHKYGWYHDSLQNQVIDMSSSDLTKMRCLIRELAKVHGVNPKSVCMTTNAFFNFMAFILAKYPKDSVCSVGSRAGKCWKKMSGQQRKPYCVLAQLVAKTGQRNRLQPLAKMKILLLTVVLAAATSASAATKIEMDVEELLEMVPYEQMVNLGMEYAIADPQVKSLMQYISGEKFKENVLSLQSSPQFLHLAEVSSTYNIDAFALANKFNSALDMPPLSYKIAYTREKRSPGDGIAGLVKEAAELTPLEDMKEAFRYKVDHNPEFKLLMSKLLSGEAMQVMEPIFKSKPFQDTKHDLKEIGIPLDQLEEMLIGHLHKFFDLNAKVEPLSEPKTN
ncbi:hypothetical protein GE061_002145 [Apolygus lucorum]|uniref:Protein G12 n=1 Tax=Apolygus lucorum TaxID=248454 RepID=A0A8S9X3U9_APOLU|nr:hypothetical protein GE061_002145 [Apolygus lucorum]